MSAAVVVTDAVTAAARSVQHVVIDPPRRPGARQGTQAVFLIGREVWR
jgi:hypothetical protein